MWDPIDEGVGANSKRWRGQMKTSVLIIDYDRPAHLRACLRALALQTRLPDQIVVVDDGSPLAGAALIRDVASHSGLPVQLVARERSAYCPAAARNEAIRHADHDYLLFLDCDILAFPDLIERHLALAARRSFLIGHCGLLNPDQSRGFLASAEWGPNDLYEAWAGADVSTMGRAANLFKRHALFRKWGIARRHKPKLMSGHFSIHAEDLFKVNGFDENFVDWGYEDDDLGLRLYKSGCQSKSLILSARALHLWHPSLAPQALERQRDRPNRAYFRRWRIPAYCQNGLK